MGCCKDVSVESICSVNSSIEIEFKATVLQQLVGRRGVGRHGSNRTHRSGNRRCLVTQDALERSEISCGSLQRNIWLIRPMEGTRSTPVAPCYNKCGASGTAACLRCSTLNHRLLQNTLHTQVNCTHLSENVLWNAQVPEHLLAHCSGHFHRPRVGLLAK